MGDEIKIALFLTTSASETLDVFNHFPLPLTEKINYGTAQK